MTQSDSSRRKIARTCYDCGHVEELEYVCKKCQSTSFVVSYQEPGLDFDLLKVWATNSHLYLNPQDEELILADERHLDTILLVLDTVPMLDDKRDLLMEALCIIVYDNTVENTKQDIKLKQRVVEELNKRQDKLILTEDWTRDYIKKVVYPQLDLDIRT